MTVQGQPRNYDNKALFSIEIDGIDVAWFTMMSELSFEFGVVEQHEGGNLNVADQTPGKAKFTPVTLSVGATDNRQLYDWARQVYDAATGSGEVGDSYKKNLSIVQRDRDLSEKKRWNLYRAWIQKYVAGEWDAKADENVIESVTLVYLWFELG